MLVRFGNNQFLLNPDGSMYWIEEKSLIVGDLHLEKSTSYIDQGNFLPPYDTIDTLERLLSITKDLLPNRIIFLGDVFHDNSAFDRLKTKEKQLFKDILNQSSKETAACSISMHNPFIQKKPSFLNNLINFVSLGL